ncbi:N-acetyltransferase family protein [Deinococcus sp.]|uniref:GNAT family N-acetyltransferase n=1 Tax=Deinococcus sp. TaxID=47478 RepID=UPI003C7CBF8C
MTPEVVPWPLRPASPADEAEVLELTSEYYAFDHIPFDAAELRQALGRLLAEPALGQVFLIGGEGGETAGYLTLTYGFDLEFGGQQATITDLYLRPAYRGDGLGRASLAALETVCTRLGIGALELQVERGNLAAQAFYLGLGFQPHDRLPMSKRLEVRHVPA